MLGVVNDVVPVPPVSTVPPVAVAYQSTVSPAPTLADMATVPVPHLELSVPAGGPGTAITVAVTAVLVAEVQPVVVFLVCA